MMTRFTKERRRINTLNVQVFDALSEAMGSQTLPFWKTVLAHDIFDDALSVNRSWGHWEFGRFVPGPFAATEEENI
jgi:hypothetical protein